DAAAAIAAAMPAVADRLHVTHEAPAAHFAPVANAPALVATEYGLPGRFLLAIGSADPRKNIASLLRAYAGLPVALRAEYPLAVIWTHGHLATQMAELMQDLALSEHVRFLFQVSDRQLAMLYSACTAFLFPSRGEGFGLPLLEAMACGGAVLAANNSSIPEVAGDAALYFDADDLSGMTAAIQQALETPGMLDTLRRRGRERVALFSWARCARETLLVYHLVSQRRQAA
ncbi:MAG: glycosyltransferase family 4 protein, partial [Caldilineaceae bacterium]